MIGTNANAMGITLAARWLFVLNRAIMVLACISISYIISLTYDRRLISAL